MGSLNGRVAIVTGASTGIGRATAIRFLQEGADVAVNVFNNPVHDVEEAAKQFGRGFICVKADARSTNDMNSLVKATVDRFGKVDVVFCNAGILSWARTEDLTDDEWDFVIDCDLKGSFRLCRAAIPHMKKQKYGRIIVASSVSGISTGWIGHAHYCAAKAGLVGFVKSIAAELARDGITVNAVSPGMIVTEQLKSRGSIGEEAISKIGQQIPIGYVGDPIDIAAVVAFLASEEARYLTGQNLIVDGGYTIQEDFIPVGNLPPPPGYIQRYDRLIKVK
ncbi:MAG TPA: SDR family oxidoreductase [Candidatus Bathyarchaeia archaeon]|nr:SDR family oxidoreductase [Candidatus Bathyarchaeia archaeon]